MVTRGGKFVGGGWSRRLTAANTFLTDSSHFGSPEPFLQTGSLIVARAVDRHFHFGHIIVIGDVVRPFHFDRNAYSR